MNKLIEVVARAICRVQLNDGDPGQPAMRWNGTEIEPQSFPVWRDYLDEARHSLSAIEAAGMRIVPKEPTEAMLSAIMMDWQTMETAPKDGTRILAWHDIHKCPVTIQWRPNNNKDCPWIEGTYTTCWPERAFSAWTYFYPPK